MKIVKLVSENVKRLTAVQIVPEGTLVTIGGKNGAGKSSVLDSIAYALGGNALVPALPIHGNETEAKIEVDLGAIIVTRRFTRELLDTRKNDESEEDYAKRPPVFGPTKSTLLVTNKDGARYPSPQKLLDDLLGQLTFDPLAFAGMNAKAQREMLRELVGLDFSELDQEKAANFNERQLVNREVKNLEGQLSAFAISPNIPAEEISVTDLTNKLADIAAAEKVASAEAQAHQNVVTEHGNLVRHQAVLNTKVTGIRAEIENLEQRLLILRNDMTTAVENVDAHTKKVAESEVLVDKSRMKAEAAKTAVPDAEPIRQAIKDAEVTNQKIRANKKRLAIAEELGIKKKAVEQLTENLAVIEETRKKRLASTQFPVEGLGINDDGVTFNGLPLEQAATNEQMRISVAIGLALNPKLKVLLVRNGNLLDDESLKSLGEQAEAANAQVWLEYVTRDQQDTQRVSVLIEDGHTV